jgi:hypothetical protein
VNEVETRLRDVGRELAFPPEPELVGPVAARLGRPSPARSWRRPLLAAVVLAVLALAIALAVPPARSAILRFFHLGAVSVERVEALPPAPQLPLTAGFGRPLDREAAERKVGFKLVLPPLKGGEPKQVFAPGVNMLATVLEVPWAKRDKRVLLVEIEGSDLGIAKKVVQKETLVAPARVNGLDALWIRGPHVVGFVTTSSGMNSAISRVSGSSLIWQRGTRTFRIEGRLTLGEALRLAKTITPR